MASATACDGPKWVAEAGKLEVKKKQNKKSRETFIQTLGLKQGFSVL